MGSTFSSYSIAASGMYVNQAGLTVTSQNLSNINTSGYSRQAVQSCDTVLSNGVKSSGSGATLEEVRRARNQLLDSTYRQQNATANYTANQQGTLTYLQEILDEFSASDGTTSDGLQATLTNFFNGWEELAKEPSSLSNRQNVIEYANALVSTFQAIDTQLAGLQQDEVQAAGDSVAAINKMAGHLLTLNQQISKAEAGSAEACDLRDQRDLLLDELSQYTAFTAQEASNGAVTVFIGGTALVSGAATYALELQGDGSAANPLRVSWQGSKETAVITSGLLASCLQEGDSRGFSSVSGTQNYTPTAASAISNLRQGLNVLLTGIAEQVNSLHSAGYGLDGSTGLAFFTTTDSSKALSLDNLTVNPVLTGNVNKLAAGTTQNASDNTIANQICAVSSNSYFQYDGLSKNSTTFYQSLMSWLATAGSTSETTYTTQAALVKQTDSQRQSVCSVSMDEEMAAMLQYQHAYSAAARLLSTVDSLIGGLISDLGDS